jgi:hypothetical protein
MDLVVHTVTVDICGGHSSPFARAHRRRHGARQGLAPAVSFRIEYSERAVKANLSTVESSAGIPSSLIFFIDNRWLL